MYEDLLSGLIDRKPRRNTNRPGNDFKIEYSNGVQECEMICSLEPRCVAYNLQGDSCYLKDEIGKLVVQEGSWSGIVVENYRCKQESFE